MRNMIRDKWNSECYKLLSIQLRQRTLSQLDIKNKIFLVAKTVRLVMIVDFDFVNTAVNVSST